MTHEKRLLNLAGFHVELTRKKMKNLRLRVDATSVRVSAPNRTPFYEVESFLTQNRQWIQVKQEEAQARQQCTRQSLADNEKVKVWGLEKNILSEHGYTSSSRNRVKIVEMDDTIVIRSLGFKELAYEEKQKALDEFYRQQVKNLIPGLLEKWQPIVGVEAKEWGTKKMKTRWGSCNIDRRRIWLNIDLARWPIGCLEYVVVHELTHIIETNHTQRFWQLVEKAMPQWKTFHNMLKVV